MQTGIAVLFVIDFDSIIIGISVVLAPFMYDCLSMGNALTLIFLLDSFSIGSFGDCKIICF